MDRLRTQRGTTVERVSRRSGVSIVVAASTVLALVGAALLLVRGERGAEQVPARAAPVGTAAGTPEASVVVGPALLLPNLRSLPAVPAEIETAGGTRELRFAASFSNVGDGPLELLPDEATSCPRGQRHVVQAIYHDADGDGAFRAGRDRRQSTTPAGCMLFHPTHRHWHFDATARYALTRPGSDVPIAAQDKVSFCVRDSRPLRGTAGGTRTYGECARDRRQGLSVGWYDHYRASLPGQSLKLPDGLASGVYCLHTQADPEGLLRESREDDNGAVQAVRISGTEVTAAPATACAPVPG
jgi:hypothetical protein